MCTGLRRPSSQLTFGCKPRHRNPKLLNMYTTNNLNTIPIKPQMRKYQTATSKKGVRPEVSASQGSVKESLELCSSGFWEPLGLSRGSKVCKRFWA